MTYTKEFNIIPVCSTIAIAAPASWWLTGTNVGWRRRIVFFFVTVLMYLRRLRLIDFYVISRLVGFLIQIDHWGLGGTSMKSHLLGSLLRLRGQWSCSSMSMVSVIRLWRPTVCLARIIRILVKRLDAITVVSRR